MTIIQPETFYYIAYWKVMRREILCPEFWPLVLNFAQELCSSPKFIVKEATRTDICQGALGETQTHAHTFFHQWPCFRYLLSITFCGLLASSRIESNLNTFVSSALWIALLFLFRGIILHFHSSAKLSKGKKKNQSNSGSAQSLFSPFVYYLCALILHLKQCSLKFLLRYFTWQRTQILITASSLINTPQTGVYKLWWHDFPGLHPVWQDR